MEALPWGAALVPGAGPAGEGGVGVGVGPAAPRAPPEQPLPLLPSPVVTPRGEPELAAWVRGKGGLPENAGQNGCFRRTVALLRGTAEEPSP